jgi:hypothetical protein
MAETPETGGDPQTDPKPRDAAPEPTTVVGAVGATPVDPQAHIETLNKENAARRIAEKVTADERDALKQRLDDLQASVDETARKVELEKMSELEKANALRLDAERKAEETERNANEILKRATVMTLASNMNLHNAEDAVGVIDMSQVPVLNGVPDVAVVQGLLDVALAARPHWKKDQTAPLTPTPADPGAGNPPPEGEPPGQLPSYRPGDDPKEAFRLASVAYRDGHTSLPRAVHNWNKSWESDPKQRSGEMFRKPDVSLPDN